MANIKSAKKRIKTSAVRAARNKDIRTSVKTKVQKVANAVDTNNVDEAKIALTDAISSIDRAATKGVFNKKRASKKKSKLTKLVNTL